MGIIITPNVTSIAKAGSTALNGAVTLTGGTNITLTQSGQDISIAATAGSVATDAIWDAKGDLVAGTGADAAAKVTVGSNDTVLVANSAVSTGVNWSATLAGLTLTSPALNTPTITTPTVRNWDGWIDANETWTFSSADNPTGVITIPSDGTTKYQIGDRIKLTQTTVKYFIVTAVTSTTLTVYGGTDYTLANAAISANFYSHGKSPLGFPMSPAKWQVLTKDTAERSQASPTANTWYNLGSISIVIPIGEWYVSYEVTSQADDDANDVISQWITLSTANNSESDADWTCLATYLQVVSAAGTLRMINRVHHSADIPIITAAKTTFYLNAKTDQTGQSEVNFLGSNGPTIIRAICAYL